MKETYFEEYLEGPSKTTTGRTITEADIVLHAGQTGDFYPHHMDAEWCATQPFKKRIAHGTLVFSVAVGMTAAEINPRAMSYGYDKLRFIKPVFIGDTMRATSEVAELKESKSRPNAGIVTFAHELINQRGEVVCRCLRTALVKRRG